MDNEIPELRAMIEISNLFAGLEEDEIQRVLRWANEKFRTKSIGSLEPVRPVGQTPTPGSESLPSNFDDLPAFMDASKPTNGLERILAAAYYQQVIQGEPDFDSQTLNTQLKHLGYPSANITRDMVRLVDRSPKLVIQTRKEGSSQQARKKFRLTTEGVRAVEGLLRKSSEEH